MMLSEKPRWLPLVFCLLCVTAHGQETQLEPGKTIEREIGGGQSHKYKFTLQAGQFVRVVVEPEKVDVALLIAAPDGAHLIEASFGDAGELESLSAEAATGGEYQLTITAKGSPGSYRVQLEVKAAALRAAQVEMWRQRTWQSPYYWAAFTLQGEWR
jgi:hypothetical protein